MLYTFDIDKLGIFSTQKFHNICYTHSFSYEPFFFLAPKFLIKCAHTTFKLIFITLYTLFDGTTAKLENLERRIFKILQEIPTTILII